MPSYDAYSRRELRRLRSTWLRSNSTLVASMTAGSVALGAVATWLLLNVFPRSAALYYGLGVMHAGLVLGMIGILTYAHLALDKTAIHHVRGAWGEENTRDELRRARRRRLVWGWVDSISLQRGDIDHLVVTRHAGLLAVDSKWRNEIGALDMRELASDARVAARRAEAVARSKIRPERGAHRARSTALPVLPVVVVWGAAQHTVPDGVALVDGVPVVAGRRFRAWLRDLDGEPVDRGAAEELLGQLRSFREGAWQSA